MSECDAAAPSLRDALDALLACDAEAGHLAQTALLSLSDGEPLDSFASELTQRRLERFLWHDLAMWWWADANEKLAVAAALGDVLERAGLHRYAEVCWGASTTAVVTSFSEGAERGAAARVAAERSSPIHTPDTAALRWSATPGREELLGRCARDMILTERLGAWMAARATTPLRCQEAIAGEILDAWHAADVKDADDVDIGEPLGDADDPATDAVLLALLAVGDTRDVQRLDVEAVARAPADRVDAVLGSLAERGLLKVGRHGDITLPAERRGALVSLLARRALGC
ncbi:MAG TPA: hypothetical protein VFV35_00285 [Acidimicrobiales bacterium]|nr:hypothetical protein [Acidimicrobiales bacterium]